MSLPKVSIVIPIYNGENFIVECLSGILEQTYEDFECIIVNDGSIDHSLSLIEDFLLTKSPKQLFQIISISNSGVSAARNIGLDFAKGELIAFLDCDDHWSPEKLSMQVAHLMGNPHLVGAVSNFLIAKRQKNTTKKAHRLVKHRSIQSLSDGWLSLLGNGGLISSSLIYRSSVSLRFSEELSTAADLDFFLRLRVLGELGIVKEPLVTYYIHENQMHLNSDKLVRDYKLLSTNLHVFGMNHNGKAIMGNAFAMACLLELFKGNFHAALQNLVASIREDFKSPFAVFFSVVRKRVFGFFRIYVWKIESKLGSR